MSSGARYLAATLAALLLAVGAQARTTILCIGTGGHVAIEQAVAGCCHPVGSTATATELSYENRCAADCTDATLGIYAACSTYERAHSTSPPPSVLLPPTGIEPVVAPNSITTLARVPFKFSVPPRALRTTVNLC